MDRRTLDMAVPFTYAVLIIASALFFSDALVAIAVTGALALGAYYSFIRQKLPVTEGTGRDRQRNRQRPPGE